MDRPLGALDKCSPAFLEGGGETGALTRTIDWASTPLGRPDAWPEALKTLVAVMLGSSQPMFVAWGGQRIMLYNDGYAALCQDRHPAALGAPFARVWFDIMEDVGPILERAFAGVPTQMDDIRFELMRGGRPQEAHFSFSYTPVRGQDGAVAGMFCACNETTEEVLLRRRLSSEQARQRRQFEQAPGFIAILSGPDHVFEFANAAYARVAGERVFVGRSVREVFPELEGQGFFELLHGVYATGERFVADHIPITLERAAEVGPEQRFLDFIYAPITDEAGQVTGIFVEGYDVTDAHVAAEAIRATKRDLQMLNETLESRVADRTAELERAQDALRQSQKVEAIGQLTGGVAHDFNNLLTVIRGSVDLLRRPDLPEARRVRYVDAISDTVDRAAKLTGQLLAFARRQALKPEVFDVGESVSAIGDMVTTLVGVRIALDIQAPDTPIFVNADPSQFDTALVNMAVNARDAMGGEGRLSIHVRAVEAIPAMRSHPEVPGRFVAVTMADTGAGIAPDALDLIFEPFFTTKRVGEGTGLGLSQVFGFAKQSGGEVQVESTPGEGAAFTVYLPRTSAPERAAAAGSPPEALVAGEGCCVLVVEDNAEVGAFATQTLQALGYDTVLVENGVEALAELDRGRRFDVVFSDVVMPGMDGIALAEAIGARADAPAVVLTSGYSHGLATGAAAGVVLLRKPYSMEELSRTLGRAAASRR